jgi:hypothetical protein
MLNKIARARRTIRRAFNKDSEFKHGYLANIAMLLYDELNLDYPKRDELADKILKLIFD